MEIHNACKARAAHEAATIGATAQPAGHGGHRPGQGSEIVDTSSTAPVPRPRDFDLVEDSVAQRPPVRHYYGPAIGYVFDPFRNRDIKVESGLERWWVEILITSPSVIEVREQQLLKIRMADGRVVKHWFDLLVFFANGDVIAYACKHESRVGPDLTDLLQRAADTVGDAFADDYRTLTNVGVTGLRVHNARAILDCAKDGDHPAQQAIRTALPGMGKRVRLAELDAIIGDGDRGSRAGIAMIQQGLFGLLPGARIGNTTELRNLFTN